MDDFNKEMFEDYQEGQKELTDFLNTLGIDDEADVIGLKTIFGSLSLPEREFAYLSELLLSEQEKSLNNVEDKVALVQGLNASGLKAEDLTAKFLELTDAIQNELEGKLSQIKIDFLKRYIGLIVEAVNSTEGIAKRTIPVPISYCSADAKMPRYAHAGDAGMDLYSIEDVEILPGETKIISTGIKVALPLGYEFQIRPRSGQSIQTKLRIANVPATIDANFREEIKVIIENIESPIKFAEMDEDGKVSIEYGRPFIIEKGQRFAQLVLSEKPFCLFHEVENIDKVEGGRDGGFGSTGAF